MTKNEKSEQLERLSEYIEVASNIICELCLKENIIHGIDSLDSPEEIFFEEGYRYIGDLCLCEKCVRKYKKAVKNKKSKGKFLTKREFRKLQDDILEMNTVYN